MATTAPHRPISVMTTVGLLVFLGVSAVAGGVMLLVDIRDASMFPVEWLDELPLVDSWLVPGLVLGLGFGVGSLVVAYGMLARPGPLARLAWWATIALGVGQVAWIGLELVYLPGWSWLQVIYGATGLALALLPLLPSARSATFEVVAGEERPQRDPVGGQRR